ncbi:MAG: lysophospholipid acyltransferase family protein [Acidobacteriota bacterium]|nr:lysophospholipid acyltransferase family protein [Acidobacteriota bacterium]
MTVARARPRTAAEEVETPPHAPEAGRIRRFLGPLYVTGVFWYRFHSFGARILPDWAAGSVIALFTAFFFLTLRNIRKAVAANLVPVLGPCGFWRRERRIWNTLWTFAWCLTERYEQLNTDHTFNLTTSDSERWQELSSAGTGFIFITAHLGSWEVGSVLPGNREAAEMRPIHVVREPETDPRAQAFIAKRIGSRAGGLYTTHFTEDPRLGMTLLDALRRGEIVALQGDRPRTRGRVAAATLFGKPFPLPFGPAALARAAGVPLIPVFIFRLGRRRYACDIRQPIHVAATADRDHDVEAAMCRFAAELERAIASHPHQWFCFREIWGKGGG